MTYSHFQVYPTNSVSPQLTLTLHTMLSWYFCLDPNDINWKNFKILLKQWAYPKSFFIFYLNFMTYSHPQVYPTKYVTPQLTLTLQTLLSWYFCLDPNDINWKNFRIPLKQWDDPKSISIFLFKFDDSQSPPGLPNKICDPTIDAHPADTAFLMFLSRSKWFKLTEFQNSSQAMSLSKIYFYFLSQFYDLQSPPGLLNK